jgi:hypothetical protein
LSASRLQADTFAKITPSEPDDERVVASRDDEARPVLRGGADGAAPLYSQPPMIDRTRILRGKFLHAKSISTSPCVLAFPSSISILRMLCEGAKRRAAVGLPVVAERDLALLEVFSGDSDWKRRLFPLSLCVVGERCLHLPRPPRLLELTSPAVPRKRKGAMLNGKRKSSTVVVGTCLLFCISGD